MLPLVTWIYHYNLTGEHFGQTAKNFVVDKKKKRIIKDPYGNETRNAKGPYRTKDWKELENEEAVTGRKSRRQRTKLGKNGNHYKQTYFR